MREIDYHSKYLLVKRNKKIGIFRLGSSKAGKPGWFFVWDSCTYIKWSFFNKLTIEWRRDKKGCRE